MEFIVSYNKKVFVDKYSLAEWFGHYLLKISKEKKVNIFLAGGNTPKAINEYLSKNFADKINWKNINLYFGDERGVPSNSSESNYNMTFNSLLKNINIPAKNVFMINGDNFKDGENEKYSNLLKGNVCNVEENINNIDLVILGIGEDGHVASIFPKYLNLFNTELLTAYTFQPNTFQPRLTITGTIINNAKQVFIIATGKNKKEIVDIILHKKEGWKKFPAAYVKPINGKLTWLLDEEIIKII